MSGSLPQTLTNKVAIVTGSSRGLGAAMALNLAQRGAKVVITYTSPSSSSKASDLISQIRSLNNGSAAIAVQADLKLLDSPSKIVKATTDAFGPKIDILVNNAGVEQANSLKDITPEDYSSVYDLNVRGVIFMTQAVLPHLRAPARIINTSSVGARQGFPHFSLYVSSKAALEGLTRVWADELGGDGTTVNAVAPGPVQSDMLDNLPKELIDIQKKQTAVQRRVGTSEEVASTVGWLAEGTSSWVSGQTINLSGGYSMY
ncbi:MAG: hypothetical protein Q9227_009419 [Pyrenula ochraceoflavens]